ncbi:hypothetical protein F5144DRAFT_246348 [Chaetomium tenue]|uniref:Uncharacterized protein n=1 Tax=Chaetomium tenue TaxID=1854479 RepID=A0ACB7P838_9PEZI|nr:hypothetical protein F5144DRAFT_246348 [Chaetomium globosum]
MGNSVPRYSSGREEPQKSPWFSKYGGEPRMVFNQPHEPVIDSGLAPLLPRLHPTYYSEDSTTFDHMPPYSMPTGDELDMLFTSEKSQIDLNARLTTWEMGVLGEHLVNGWGEGHREMDPVTPQILERGYGVEVDESSWHSVFAKSKWYDFRLPIVDGSVLRHPLPGINGSDVWSVDVPKIWSELRVSLELANRWLRYMGHSPWLSQLVHEQRVEWMEAEPTAAELDGPRHLGPNKKPWRIPDESKVYDSEKTLKVIAELLAPRLVWTFFDDGFHPCDAADHADFYGRTVRHWNGGNEPTKDTPPAERQLAFLSVYIHVKPLRVLLNPESTLSERCHARWSMALTMLHQLMASALLLCREGDRESSYINH